MHITAIILKYAENWSCDCCDKPMDLAAEGDEKPIETAHQILTRKRKLKISKFDRFQGKIVIFGLLRVNSNYRLVTGV